MIETNNIPQHIAIIMDGNGRWANERGKERSYGHQAGVEAVRKITAECTRLGVKYLTLYTFSTENWGRPADEVAALMGLVLSSLEDEIFMKNNVRFRVIGDVKRLPDAVQQKLRETEEHTAKNDAMTMVVALSYSSRWEITEAVRQIIQDLHDQREDITRTLEFWKTGGIRAEDITEETISQHLATNFMPDPDLLIRTGGELRISNYLLWQIAYSELYFCDTYWPDFNEAEKSENRSNYKMVKGNGKRCCYAPLFTVHFIFRASAQDVIINPDISYAGTPRQLEIGGLAVKGVEGYEDYVLTGLSGLSIGQVIDVPGTEITEAVKRYWKHGLFSKVAISADSIVGNKVYLCIHLATRPRVSTINYYGLKKSEKEDMEAKLGIMKGSQITPNMIDRAKILAKKYFDEKGYNNAEIDIAQRDDVTGKNEVILDVSVDKKSKMKVREIVFDGNGKLSKSKLTGSMFKKGAFGKINEAGKFKNMFKAKKFTPERYDEAKSLLIEKYNELGYRDATILEDSVWTIDDKHVNVYVKIDEGEQYYIRNITWVGNTVVTTDYLNRALGMQKGDVYNQKLMNKRLKEDEDAVGNYYWNNGYLFYQLEPTEVNIVGDSIDLEMRIQEGTQAHISHVRIYGNDRLYEEVVRRELRTKPGDLFSKDAIQRSAREIASTGFFDPEKVNPDIKPNYDDGTVDINWELEQKSNDQLEFSLGWGQTGIIGRIGVKLNNFSMRNLFGKNKMHRGIMPIGDGEQLSLSFQSNGSYYSSVSTGYSTGWFGGKRPNALSISAFYSKQSDISSTYRNSAWMNNYYNYYGGYGSYNSGYYDYTSYDG